MSPADFWASLFPIPNWPPYERRLSRALRLPNLLMDEALQPGSYRVAIMHAVMLLRLARVVERGDGLFELWDGQGKKLERWLIPVCTGFATSSRSDTVGHPLPSDPPFFENAVFGDDIVDVLACTPDLRRVTSSYCATAPVLGWPQMPDEASIHDVPIRVHETPLAWLRNGCRGVVLSCAESRAAEWLRWLPVPVIADSVSHGDALTIKMRRPPVPLPRILVAA